MAKIWRTKRFRNTLIDCSSGSPDKIITPMRLALRVVLVLAVSGCASTAKVGEYDATGPHDVYIVSHGWHTGIVVPAQPLYEKVSGLEQRFGNARYIEIGWGDRGFYQANEITGWLTLKAILWPTESVVHAVKVPADVHVYFPDAEYKTLCLNAQQLSSLIHFLSNSFERNSAGHLQPLERGIYGNSQFYRGAGNYYWLNTCNTWTAKGLKSIGLDISPTFKMTARSIMDYLLQTHQQLRAIPTSAAPSYSHCSGR